MSIINTEDIIDVWFDGDPKKLKSVQAHGYRAARTAGLKMTTEVISGGKIVRCRFTESQKDGRLSNYDFLRNMEIGKGHVLPWDLSEGAPAPEYRPIKKVYDELVKKGWKMRWQASAKDVIITRLA